MLDVDGWSAVWFSHMPRNHHLVWGSCTSLQQAARRLRAALWNEDCTVCFANVRHERIHTKRGSCVKMQAEEEGVDDLATLEVLDEVREARQHVTALA